MTTRILAIIQLSITFSLLLWHASAPFMGAHYAYKKEAGLYDALIHGEHRKRFEALPPERSRAFLEERERLKKSFEKPFFEKLLLSFKEIAALPLFFLIWLLLSVPVCILALKKAEAAPAAAWLLPLVAASYALDNHYFAGDPRPSREERLFPSEQALVPDLKGSVFEQQQQLKRAWRRHLAKHWAPEGEVEQRAEAGAFAFMMARLEALKEERRSAAEGASKKGAPLLALFVVWNLLLAAGTGREVRAQSAVKIRDA